MTTTTMTQAVQAMQARVLGILRDGRMWEHEELAAQLADEVGWEATALVPKAVERLVGAGLARRGWRDDLVEATWRGMRGAAAADPGQDGALLLSSASGVGVAEPVNDRDSPNHLVGGAEDLPGTLNPISR